MRIDVLTIFPGMCEAVFGESIIKRAREKGIVDISVHNIRDWTHDSHRSVDDKPFGGGPGMVMKPEPIFEAVEEIRKKETVVILLSPQGEKLDHEKVRKIAGYESLLLICGRYEGIDERVKMLPLDYEISIGDYVLFGGEVAAMVICEAVVRLIDGVLGSDESAKEESFVGGRLEYPQYTRPREFRGMAVPEALLSGDHKRIREWRLQKAKEITEARRKDLPVREDS